MGKTSRRKFSQLASMFSRRKGSAKDMLGKDGRSNDHLLLNDEPILAEDDDDSETEGAGGGRFDGGGGGGGSKKKTPTKGKYSAFS
jgi:hypothetical protein